MSLDSASASKNDFDQTHRLIRIKLIAATFLFNHIIVVVFNLVLLSIK